MAECFLEYRYSLSISSMVKPIVFMIKHIHHPDFRPTALQFLSVSSTALATASTVDTDWQESKYCFQEGSSLPRYHF